MGDGLFARYRRHGGTLAVGKHQMAVERELRAIVNEKGHPRCVDCKFINNEIDKDTGFMKCFKACPYINTKTLTEFIK